MTDPITTGWPPSELMQDDCKALSKWLASRPDARRLVREVIARLDVAQTPDADSDWQGMDGAAAFRLIKHHADGWDDVGACMEAWRLANVEEVFAARINKWCNDMDAQQRECGRFRAFLNTDDVRAGLAAPLETCTEKSLICTCFEDMHRKSTLANHHGRGSLPPNGSA